jgi:hypothetical protein
LVPELSLVEVSRFYRIHHPLGGVAHVSELIQLMLSWMDTRYYEDID